MMTVMVTFRDDFRSRKEEISEYCSFLEKLQVIEETTEETKNFDSIFNDKTFFSETIEGYVDISFQKIINIMKSNLSLMVYNLIEFTVTNLMTCIYDEIAEDQLPYEKVSEPIRALWRKSMLKGTKDPEAKYSTFIRTNEDIINAILNKKTISINVRETMPAGNLDGKEIDDVFTNHGIHIRRNSENFRPDILTDVKEHRNNLAHGSASFVDELRQKTLNDFQSNILIIENFLEELISLVEQYLANGEYKAEAV